MAKKIKLPTTIKVEAKVDIYAALGKVLEAHKKPEHFLCMLTGIMMNSHNPAMIDAAYLISYAWKKRDDLKPKAFKHFEDKMAEERKKQFSH